MQFLFWFIFILFAIMFLGFEGIFAMIGVCLAIVLLFFGYLITKEYLEEHPEKKKRFMKVLIGVLSIAVVTIIAQLVISNVIYNRYHLDYALDKKEQWPNSDCVSGHLEMYEESFLARSDSAAIAKAQSYVMETASDLYNSDSNVVDIRVISIGLKNLTVDEYEYIEPRGIGEKIEKEIRAKYHFQEKIAEPTESATVSGDSIDVDTLCFE